MNPIDLQRVKVSSTAQTSIYWAWCRFEAVQTVFPIDVGRCSFKPVIRDDVLSFE